MLYVLEWNQGYYESNDLNSIIEHPQFNEATLFVRTPLGLCAI